MSRALWSHDAEQRLHGNGCGLGCAVCGGGAVGVSSLVPVLAKVAGGGSGGIPGRSGTPGDLALRVASAATVLLAARRAFCRGFASLRGGVQRDKKRFSCEVFCVSVVGRPGRTNGACVVWRVAVVVAAIRICAEAGQRSLFLTSEGGVRVRGLPVACYSGAAGFWLVPSGENDAFGQCDHAGGPSVCELREFGCPPDCRITSFFPGHAAAAKDKPHPYALSSEPRSEQEAHDSTKYRVRCREGARSQGVEEEGLACED
ncbi:hypothetical protein TcCL_Unassigned01721 [Trypanosoma cruzi]|nr:hypothetical protein TcCL_Unassigned01721 [Trypanosoma cruzi]